MLRRRLVGSTTLGALGFRLGDGTGIVGGPFGAVAGVGIFATIGACHGWSAGPDAVRLAERIGRAIARTGPRAVRDALMRRLGRKPKVA